MRDVSTILSCVGFEPNPRNMQWYNFFRFHMGTSDSEKLRFEMVPTWEPRFYTAPILGLRVSPPFRCEASFAFRQLQNLMWVRDFFTGMTLPLGRCLTDGRFDELNRFVSERLGRRTGKLKNS